MILTDADLALIAADVAAIIAERPLAVTIRRGDVTLLAQTGRVFATSGATTRRGEATAAARWPLTLIGPAGMDVRVGDRFNDYQGALCEVMDVHHDRRAFTQAGVELAQ